MRLWLSKNSEVPLREQLVTQILLGIVSQDLKPGQRLPSTRELAMRFHIHANTVSAAYRDLAERGWVDFRKGSGIYVREPGFRPSDGNGIELDQIIATLFQAARDHGYTLADIQRRVQHFFAAQPPDHFLIIEPDRVFREILMAEIEQATGFRVVGATLDAFQDFLAGAAVVVMPAYAEDVRRQLPPNASLLVLRLRSTWQTMEGAGRPPSDALISVVSRWPEFLKWANTLLVAAGIDPDALDLREARGEGWKRGLAASSLVITDALTAVHLPQSDNLRVFKIISDSSLEELNKFKAFVSPAPSS
jgi:GntR family transcriptional regulator